MIFPSRFRRRLTVAFVLVVAVSSGLLSLSTYMLVRRYRLHASVGRALDVTQVNLAVAPELTPNRMSALLRYYGARKDVDAVVIDGAEGRSSDASVTAADVPAGLAAATRSGGVHYRWVTVHHVPYLVTGVEAPGAPAYRLYLFFSVKELFAGLHALRDTLVVGCLILIILAGAVGRAVARRTLAPVRLASEAARALADGMLETRVAVATDDEFGAWARCFNEMASALEDKVAALSAARDREVRFTADVAHELRTPLSSLVGASSLLAEHLAELPPDARRPAELVVMGGSRLSGLVEGLLELAVLDAGRQPAERAPVALDALVRSVVRLHGWEEQVAIKAAEAVVLTTSPQAVERIVVNLVANAVHHAGRGVCIGVRSGGGWAEIEVADRGPGIPEEAVPHLFDRFYKVDPSRPGEGSGLGLAIASEHARTLGGTIAVSNRPGGGARFTLRLPSLGATAQRRPVEQSPTRRSGGMAGHRIATTAPGADPAPAVRGETQASLQ